MCEKPTGNIKLKAERLNGFWYNKEQNRNMYCDVINFIYPLTGSWGVQIFWLYL